MRRLKAERMSAACFIELTILCLFPKILQRPVVPGIMTVHLIRFKERNVAAVGVGRVATAGGTDVATADVGGDTRLRDQLLFHSLPLPSRLFQFRAPLLSTSTNVVQRLARHN